MSPAVVLAVVLSATTLPVLPANIIDGSDERGALTEVGPALGLSAAEIARIRTVSGHVVCASPEPVTASGALFLTNAQVLTAGHVLFQPSGEAREQCFFRQQKAGSEWLPLVPERSRFGAKPPKPGSNNDWAIVKLAAPIAGAEPFPVPPAPPSAGDGLIVVSAQPAGFENLDPNVPVGQGCSVRRVPVSSAATNFYRSDCDAGGGSSGGMNLQRVNGELSFRGMTISTGPWRDPAFVGAPYDEKKGSVTTSLMTDAAILEAGRALAQQ